MQGSTPGRKSNSTHPRSSQRSTGRRAVVITAGMSYRGDGSTTTVRPGLERDLVSVLEATRRWFTSQCTIVVDGVPLGVLAAQSEAARAAGWSHSQIGPWTLFHDGDRAVALGCRSAMRPVLHFGVLFHEGTEPGMLALLLDRYQLLTGCAWRGTCATTALAAIRLTWPNERSQPLWNFAVPAPWRGVGPLVWSRELSDEERSWGYVHTFDADHAYLGSALGAECAWSSLEPGGPQRFDHRLPGYWELRLDTGTLAVLAEEGRPSLLPPGSVRDGCVRVTTPYAKLLQDLGLGFDVLDSLTGSALLRADGSQIHGPQSQILRKWAIAMRDARAAAASWPDPGPRAVLERSVKRTYTDATGAMQRKGMRIYRADWAHTLIDLWRANLYRRMLHVYETSGMWPVKVKTDSVSYADRCADPGGLAAILRLDQGAHWHHEATATTQAWLTAQTPGKGRR